MVKKNIKENTRNTDSLDIVEEMDLENNVTSKETDSNEQVKNEEAIEEKAVQNNTQNNKNDSNDSIEEEFSVEDFMSIKKQLDEESAKNKEYLDLLQRKAAEFDNYRKRTIKEKESTYANAICDTISKLIPVVDNLERALQVAENVESNGKALKDGVTLVYKQLLNSLDDLDVKPIETEGQSFNPEYHNAVMHIEDDSYGENVIVEEFQKGYIYKDEIVIRHSMVKVAN